MGIWDYMNSATDKLKRNAPDVTTVKHAVRSTYDYSWSAVTNIDNAVRVYAPDVTAVKHACRSTYDYSWSAVTNIDNTVRVYAPDVTPVKHACRSTYDYSWSAVTKIDNAVKVYAPDVTAVKHACRSTYDYSWSAVTKIDNAVKVYAPDVTAVKHACRSTYDYSWSAVTKIDNAVKVYAPDVTAVKHACRSTYDYSWSAVTKIDNAVRVTAVHKLNNIYLPDEKARSEIVRFANSFAKTAAIFTFHESLKAVPGGRWIYSITSRAVRDYSESEQLQWRYAKDLQPLPEAILHTQNEKFNSNPEMASQFSDRIYDAFPEEDDPKIYSNPTLPSQSPEVPKVRSVGKLQRGTNFTTTEELLLVSGWLNVSKDGAIGSNQDENTFWGRIIRYVQENGGGTRTKSSLKNKWADINKACSKFVGLHAQVERRSQSGTTMQSRLQETRDTYQRFFNKPFKYEHCWEILKYEPKWTDTFNAKKSKNHIDAGPGSSLATLNFINLEDSFESGVNHNRPLGQKASKQQKGKGKEVVQDTASSVVLSEYLKQKIELQKQMVAQHKEQVGTTAQIADDRIMLMDISQLDPTTAQYVYSRRMEIMRKRGFNL